MTVLSSKTGRRGYLSTHVFNFRLFLEGIKRLRIFAIVVAVLALTASALIPISVWLDDAFNAFAEESLLNPSIACVPAGIMVLVAPLFAADLFSFLFKRKQSDFFHAIPYTRTCVYVSFVAAILAVTAAILAGCGVVSGVLWSLCPIVVVDIGALCAYVLICLLGATMLTGFMLLALTVTGTEGSAAMLFLLFTSITRIIAAIFLGMLEGMFIIDSETMWETSILSPLWFLPVSTLYYLIEDSVAGLMYSPENLIYSLVVTVALYALSGLLYTRRHSEMAGNPAPGRRTQALFRILFTIPFALLLPLCVWHGTDLYFIVIIVVTTLLVYFLYELITTKRARNMLKALPGLVTVAAAVLLFCGIFFGVRSFILNETITGDDIESVTFDSRRDGNRTYSDVQLRDIAIEEPAVWAVVADCLAEAQRLERTYGRYVDFEHYRTVTIELTNGRSIRRRVHMDEESFRALYTAMAKEEVYRDTILSLPPHGKLHSVEMEALDCENRGNTVIYDGGSPELSTLYRVFQDEFESLSDEARIACMTIDEDIYADENDSIIFRLCFRGNTRAGGRYTYHFRNYYNIDPAVTPRTHAALLALWGQNYERQYYPLRGDLPSNEAILADISAYFGDDGRIPDQGYYVNSSYESVLNVYRADGTMLFTDRGEVKSPALITVADRLAETIGVTGGMDIASYTPSEDTCIVKWVITPIPEGEDEYISEIILWMVCDLTPDDIEVLRKTMW